MNLKSLLALLLFVKGVQELRNSNDPADATVKCRVVDRHYTYDLKAEFEVMTTAEVEPNLPNLRKMGVFQEVTMAFLDATDEDGLYEKSWAMVLTEDDLDTEDLDEGSTLVLKVTSVRSSNQG